MLVGEAWGCGGARDPDFGGAAASRVCSTSGDVGTSGLA